MSAEPNRTTGDAGSVRPPRRDRHAHQGWVAVASGLLFGAGLGVGGMTKPHKVIGFLDFGGNWDPSLAFVMLGAISVHALAYRLVSGSAGPLFAAQFAIPTRRDIDGRLLVGAAVFGVGWGLAGFCPGPALVSLGSGSVGAIAFVLMFFVGSLLVDGLTAALARRRAARATPPDAAGHAC